MQVQRVRDKYLTTWQNLGPSSTTGLKKRDTRTESPQVTIFQFSQCWTITNKN